MKKLVISGLLSAALVLSFPASATIIDGGITSGEAFDMGGSFVNLGSEPSGLVVGNDNFQDPNLYGFNEDQNLLLDSDLAINVGGSSILAGTEVASHYVFFDPDNSIWAHGWVEFDSAVLGIITSTGKLLASDFLLNNDVTYLNPGARGLESVDSAWIDSTNENRIGLSFRASTPGDYIRVLTAHSPAAVPAPTSLALLGLGLLLMARRQPK
ncbi:PEP-CTERM sorting domain-containing protein [Pseudomonadota bacterium]